MDDAPHLHYPPPQDSSWDRVKRFWWILPLIAVAAVATYWFAAGEPPAPAAPAPAPRSAAPPAPPTATAPEEPAVRHPIEQAQPAAPVEPAPLPPLGESDKAVADELAALAGGDVVGRFLVTSGFVQRFVATVDNLPRNKAPVRMWPVQPTGGQFVTDGPETATTIGAQNAARYEPFLRAMDAVDTGKAVALYVRYYPLLQEAYRDLGYPRGNFNDRVVEAIDHLLATPDVQGPVALSKPWVMWTYADPALEARSSGQKLLIRMGSANAARVKAKLRDVRRQITRSPPAAAAAS